MVTVADLLSYVASGIVIIAAIIKLCTIRPSRPTPAQRHLLIALFAFAMAHALAVPTTQLITAHVDPFPYATNLVSHALAMLAGYSLVAMLAYALDSRTAPSQSRGRATIAIPAIALSTMLTLLLASDVGFGDEFTAVSAKHGSLIAYQLVFLGYMSFCASRIVLLLRSYLSRRDIQVTMRWGLRAVVFGAGAGIVWIIWAILVMATTHADRPLVEHPTIVAEVVGAVCITLMALGSTMSAWGARIHRTIRNCRLKRALRDITPLWRLLTTVIPDVTLRQPNLTDPELLLYRRVIEIRDAQRRLLSYVPPGIPTQVVLLASARERRLDTIAVRTEAAALVIAIDAYRARRRQPTEQSWIRFPDSTQPSRLDEARWLIRVHAAMRDDRAVGRVVAWAHRQVGTDPAQSDPDVGVGDTSTVRWRCPLIAAIASFRRRRSTYVVPDRPAR
jgi:hypothetical protein